MWYFCGTCETGAINFKYKLIVIMTQMKWPTFHLNDAVHFSVHHVHSMGHSDLFLHPTFLSRRLNSTMWIDSLETWISSCFFLSLCTISPTLSYMIRESLRTLQNETKFCNVSIRRTISYIIKIYRSVFFSVLQNLRKFLKIDLKNTISR